VRPGLISAKIDLDVRSESALPPVQGRRDQLQQVILNLLMNAIDVTPAGGRIQLTTRSRPDREDGAVEVAVSDTGPGIPSADRRRIFEPFYSTKEAGRGTGLGLFITGELVREHKGRIELDSEEGRGSTFRVILPAAPGHG
jgi:signal transduction histidine kinase